MEFYFGILLIAGYVIFRDWKYYKKHSLREGGTLESYHLLKILGKK